VLSPLYEWRGVESKYSNTIKTISNKPTILRIRNEEVDDVRSVLEKIRQLI